ncbi:MAG: DUF2934 domain-containing protein [Nitrospirota bacterium]|nr:DUF2934 domain-containing protein [Nitrospirota bacterium]
MSRRDKNGVMSNTGSINGTPLSDQLSEWINRRAYELYELRGGDHGHDAEDWFEAERQIRAEVATGSGGGK